MTKVSERLKSFGVVAVSAGLILALLLGSVVPAQAAEEKVVKIGLYCAFTGAVATTATQGHYGTLDYIRWINDQGGIDGVTVKGEWEDTRAEIPRFISAHKRFIHKGVLIEISPLAGGTETVVGMCQRDEIPHIYADGFTPPMVTSSPTQWVVCNLGVARDVIGFFCKWAAEDWTGGRPARIGGLVSDDVVHRDAAGVGFPYYAEKLGLDYVGSEYIPLLGVIDSSVEQLRLAAKKPDYVLLCVYGATATTVTKDQARLEMQNRGIKLMTDMFAIDESIIRIVGRDAEGIYKMAITPPPIDIESPGMKLVLEVAKKYRGLSPEDMSLWYTQVGWVTGAVAVEALRLAIEKVGYEGLSGRALRDGLFSIRDLDLGLMHPVTITEEKPYIADLIRVYQVQQGRLVLVNDWTGYPTDFTEELFER